MRRLFEEYAIPILLSVALALCVLALVLVYHLPKDECDREGGDFTKDGSATTYIPVRAGNVTVIMPIEAPTYECTKGGE